MPQKENPRSKPAERPTGRAEQRAGRVRFDSLVEARVYREWKTRVPVAVRRIVETAMLGKKAAHQPTGSPLVDDYLQRLADEFSTPSNDESFASIRNIETDKGTSDGIALLQSKDASFASKLQIWESHLSPLLHYLKEEDLAPPEVEEQEPEEQQEPAQEQEQESESTEQMENDDDVPPPPSGEIMPTMDDPEKREGEPRALYRVRPFRRGYFAQERCDEWDAQRMVWKCSSSRTERLSPTHIDEIASRALSGKLRIGQRLAIPLPPDWGVDMASLKLPAGIQPTFRCREDGSVFLETVGKGKGDYEVMIGPLTNAKQEAPPNASSSVMEKPRLPQELQQAIAETMSAQITPNAKAEMIIKTVRDHLTYSTDSSFNAKYRQDTAGYVERVWNAKQADCDVANTVALFALQAAGIHARMVRGHFVKEISKDGSAILHSGSAHAWLEIWDQEKHHWFTADATPKGDPSMDDERPDEKKEDSEEGDHEEKEAEMMSEEDLEKLIKEMEEVDKKEVQPEEKKQDPIIEDFAEKGECSYEEARDILALYDRVRKIPDTDGIPIYRKLKDGWKHVVTTRMGLGTEYRGPVRMSEADELDDAAEARIDVRSKEADPSGGEKRHETQKPEQLVGGMDIYIQLDLSGSMSEIDPASQKPKTHLQRDFGMMFVASLMECATEEREVRSRLQAACPMRVQVSSIHGDASVDLPLTGAWTEKEMVALYRALSRAAGGGTPDHLGLAQIEATIKHERDKWEKTPHQAHEQRPLSFVAVSLDGGSNNAADVRAGLNRMRKDGALVYGYGMGEQARAIEAIYGKHARVVKTLEEHVQAAAQDTLAAFRALAPERMKG